MLVGAAAFGYVDRDYTFEKWGLAPILSMQNMKFEARFDHLWWNAHDFSIESASLAWNIGIVIMIA